VLGNQIPPPYALWLLAPDQNSTITRHSGRQLVMEGFRITCGGGLSARSPARGAGSGIGLFRVGRQGDTSRLLILSQVS
jgi:hypothetical protein